MYLLVAGSAFGILAIVLALSFFFHPGIGTNISPESQISPILSVTIIPSPSETLSDTTPASSPTPTSNPLVYLQETNNPSSSKSKTWWLNSGGVAIFSGNFFSTLQGDSPAGSLWQKAYNTSNPVDTDAGSHPQNIFRLVQKQQWQNFQQELYFQLNTYRQSFSPNRNESNGVLLFNRYQDGDNLYYSGLRVDGNVVIKKKQAGKYYTIAIKKILPGSYNPSTSQNLIPIGKRIGIKSIVRNVGDGVLISLYTDIKNNGNWVLMLEGKDSPGMFGEYPITNSGHVGIRTDFMDVLFMNYSIAAI
jgi:hypothetical protein